MALSKNMALIYKERVQERERERREGEKGERREGEKREREREGQ